MIKKKIFLSLVLFNSKYIDIFFRYTLKSIVNSISCLNNKNYDFVIFITTSDKDLVSIKKKFSKINKLDLKIFYIIRNINNLKNKYKILSQFQVEHFALAKNSFTRIIRTPDLIVKKSSPRAKSVTVLFEIIFFGTILSAKKTWEKSNWV